MKKGFLLNSDLSSPNAQSPLPTSGDSVYTSDIDYANSDFTGWVGDPSQLFQSPFSTSITNISGDNPKSFIIAFKRTLNATQIAFGENNGGDFSSIKVIALGSGGFQRGLADDSDNAAKITSLSIPFKGELFNSFKVEFHTSDPVSLSNINIQKAKDNTVQIRGINPNGEIASVKTNILGNLLVSLDEQKDAFGRLKIAEPYTIFDNSLTSELSDTLFWDDLINGAAGSVYDRSKSVKVLSVINNGDYVVRQTKQRFKYQPAKALRHGTGVLTEYGFKPVEEINVGDVLFDENGNKTSIKEVLPQGIRQIYRITFDDGTNIDCDGGHLWKVIVRQNSQKGKKRVLTTLDMLAECGENPTGFQRWRIPKSPILNIREKDVLIDAYTLGLILGDGHVMPNGSVQFTTADEEIIKDIPYSTVSHKDKYRYGINGIAKKIRLYDLIGKNAYTKFIPKDYLYNSYDIRLAVIRGLMDTDGTVSKKDGTCSFSSSSLTLAEDLAFLVRSIGGQAKIKPQNPFYYNEDGERIAGQINYRVRVISPVNPFRLQRKAIYYKKRERISFDRYIHSIKPIGIDFATCLHVESDEHTFLIENNIVTHNSHEFFITGLLSTESDLRKRVGLVDYDNIDGPVISNNPKNGVYFENNAGVLSWNIVNNGVITESATQDNWNIDKADGEGPSSFLFNPNATNIFTGQLEWLGVGVVLVGFAIGAGSVIFVHAFEHASVDGFLDVYMRTANLPVAYEITSLGSSGSLKTICSSVISGGGFNPRGLTNAVRNTTPVTLVSGDTELLCGIRLRSNSFEFSIMPEFISILSTSNANSLWYLTINPTYAGTVTWNDKVNTEVQEAFNNNNLVTAQGIIIAAGTFSNNSDNLNEKIDTSLRIAKDLHGNLDELWLCVTALGNETYYGAINFKELV